jgi:hypothetical protein
MFGHRSRSRYDNEPVRWNYFKLPMAQDVLPSAEKKPNDEQDI